jgi:sialidase-1
MHRWSKSLPATFAAAILFLGWSPSDAADSRPNVLFIAVDDLRPELRCYGAEHIHSPNIDRLAETAVRFDRAYCQQAVCNPSRTSLMTGLRPDTIGVTGNHSHFRANLPEVVTLPQHFKNHGYHAAAIGKLYHGVFPDGCSNTKWDTMGDPQSWSAPAIRFGPRYYYTEDGIEAAKATFQRVYRPTNPGPDDWTRKLVFGPATESPDVPDGTLYDGQVADAAVEALRKLQRRPEQPFFLAVGFIKPHSPYIAPKKYFDLYDDVHTADDHALPSGAPAFAGHGSGELRRYTDQPQQGEISNENQRRVRQAYYACVSYIDAQIGRVLNELDRLGLADNTIVSLYGDHGYHLGEQGLWGKTTNFELDTRVPLFIRAPGMKAAGKASTSLVELVDLYPTLADLAGLPVGDHLQGKSLSSLLDDPTRMVKEAAISQYPRGGGLMGYSMRTQAHRLTQWIHRASGEIKATELYDYAAGSVETKNVAKSSPQLARELTSQFVLMSPSSFAPTVKIPAAEEFNANNSSSFELSKPGPFRTLDTRLGNWTTQSGTALVDNKHATTGRQCLQLTGGKETVVELELTDGIATDGNLTFRAERWTKRTPFSFRIEKQSAGKWTEIFDGDKQVRVGRPFLTTVDVTLDDPQISRLRFSVVSPPNTGVLIDDIQIAAPRPQQITGVEAVPFALPALVGNQNSALLKLKIETSGRIDPISLTQLQVTLLCDESDVESAQVYYSGANSQFTTTTPFGKTHNGVGRGRVLEAELAARSPASSATAALTITGQQPLAEGNNYLWVACTLSDKANVDHRVGAVCQRLNFSNGKTVELKTAPSIQQLGVSVRNSGDDDVHTYRIPGLATTLKGSLIAVYDVRRRSGGDLPGDIDVGMSRSADGGRTWQPMKVIMDMGNDPSFRYDGIGDPTVLVDKVTGTVWCAATWSHGNRSWFGSQPGLEPVDTGQFILVKSDDDGVTWSKPINITQQVKKPEWSFLLQGPGKGITLSDGTIVLPAQYQDPPHPTDKQANRLPHSTFIYSRDHGKTWKTATGAWDDTTESQVVELVDGQIMINCRNNRLARRAILTTSDMGQTWKEHPTHNRALIEPGSCMASLINVGRELSQRGLSVRWPNSDESASKAVADNKFLLFSNPDSLDGRNHITIKASLDGGMTWPARYRLLLDEQNGRGYSCMTMIDSETVGIIYEGSQAHMTFQRVKIADVLSPPKNQKTKNVVAVATDTANTGTGRPQKEFAFARVFGDHMVLQAQQPIRIWGHARPGAEVNVALGTANANAKTASSGRWQVEFPARPYNADPQTLTATSAGETACIRDVLIGEVWLCAGQSNMEWPLIESAGGKEAVQNSHDTQLRLMNFVGAARGGSGVYTEAMIERLEPDRFSTGHWGVASPASSAEFSAVGYYFGQQLRKTLDCPIGMINVSIGGTPIEAWVSSRTLTGHPTLSRMVRGNWLDNAALDPWCKTRATFNLKRGLTGELNLPGDQFGPNHSFKPGFMYEAGIRPFTPMSIRGALWYQGESNGDNPDRTRQYDAAFPLLVSSWRTAFRNAQMPIAFVQLPAMGRPNWPVFREYQRRSLSKLNDVGMAITIDTGEIRNVHPADKQPVGQRLAQWALANAYARPGPAMGPLYRSKHVDGSSLVLTFDTDGDALVSADGAPPNNFEVAGDDGVYHPATARIVGNQVRLDSPKVPRPKNARYAWSDFPDPKPNLFNASGIPASPLSTEREIPDSQPVTDDDRPNILLIVSEDNGPELGCYGDKYANTPNLDEFAAQSIRFKTAYVTQAVCSPSRGSLLTGLFPHQNGQIGLATHSFEMFKAWPTTYSILKDAGYRTGMLGKLHVNPEHVVENYIDFRAITSANFAKKNLGDYAKHSHDFISSSRKPFFLTVNFPDAHWPVQNHVEGRPRQLLEPDDVAPMPYIGFDNARLRGHVQGYYNCMTRLDECIGELLDVLQKSGKADNTLVIYIGDHGAQFARGKVYVTEGGLRIPFIVRWPGKVKAGYASNQMVSTIDILPTIVNAAGATVPRGLPGKDLAAILGGDETLIREYLFGERNTDAAILHYPQRAIRDSRYKLIKTLMPGKRDPATHKYLINGASNFRGSPTYEELKTASEKTQDVYADWLNPPEYQLFDLHNDPNEFENVADDPQLADVRSRLIRRLELWQQQTGDRLADPKLLAKLTAEVEHCLEKNIRVPEGGWKYLEYLAPDQAADADQSIFQHRSIPAGVPLEGHAKDATQYAYRTPSLLVTPQGSMQAITLRRPGLRQQEPEKVNATP